MCFNPVDFDFDFDFDFDTPVESVAPCMRIFR